MIMKKFSIILAIAATAMVLVACGKGKDKNNIDHSGGYTSISGTIHNMPDDVESYTLKAIVEGDEDRLSVATCDVAASGSFSLQLPAAVADAYLKKASAGAPAGIAVSDPDAKSGMLTLELYDSYDYYIDKLIYTSFSIAMPNISISIAMPSYSSSDFTMKGRGDVDVYDFDDVDLSVNMRFVKGWNWMVLSASGNITTWTFTGTGATKLPGEMMWYLDSDLGPLLGR